ncbi:MAG TPA: hypothetical protein VGK19_16570 [Capsulimonadaceae bacterium]|jgi:hypothetical protein
MKKVMVIAAVLGAFQLCGATPPSRADTTSNSLLANGGFEMAGTQESLPQSWGLEMPKLADGKIATVTRSKERVHEGAWALAVSDPVGLTGRNVGAEQKLEAAAFKSGVSVRVTVSALTLDSLSKDSFAYASVAFYDATGKSLNNVVGAHVLNEFSKPSQWLTVSATGTVPTGFGSGCHAKLSLYLWEPKRTGSPNTVYFDDVSVAILPDH